MRDDGPDTSPSNSILGELQALPGVKLLATAVTDRERLLRDLSPVRADAVISCLASRAGGIRDSWQVEHQANANLLAWAETAGPEHFTLLSAICVQKPRLQFQLAKARFEGELEASGQRYSIVRPTAFFKSLSGQIERVRAGRPFLLFGNGALTACKPIGESDLARYLRATLEDGALANRTLPIGGPGPALTPLDQAALLAQLCGVEARTRSVPPAMLRAAARVLDLPGLFSTRMADRAEFARIGHYYATESMLVWDAERNCYDAQATPEFGEETLEDAYRAALSGVRAQRLGEHAMFSSGE